MAEKGQYFAEIVLKPPSSTLQLRYRTSRKKVGIKVQAGINVDKAIKRTLFNEGVVGDA